LKAITHDVFSLGVGIYLVYHIQPPTLSLLVLLVWLAFATNELIDVLGHVRRGGRPARSFWTHSVFTAPVWGIAAALASAYVLDIVLCEAMTTSQALFAGGLGAVFACSHLLLDALTEGGVYLGRRRVALAHMRYDNLVLNGAFSAFGALLILATFV
jgi:Protein of unknown function (DUF1286)